MSTMFLTGWLFSLSFCRDNISHLTAETVPRAMCLWMLRLYTPKAFTQYLRITCPTFTPRQLHTREVVLLDALSTTLPILGCHYGSPLGFQDRSWAALALIKRSPSCQKQCPTTRSRPTFLSSGTRCGGKYTMYVPSTATLVIGADKRVAEIFPCRVSAPYDHLNDKEEPRRPSECRSSAEAVDAHSEACLCVPTCLSPEGTE